MLLMRANPLLGQMGGGWALEISTFGAPNRARLTYRCHFTGPKKSSTGPKNLMKWGIFRFTPRKRGKKLNYLHCVQRCDISLCLVCSLPKKGKHICWEVQNWGCPETHQGAAFLSLFCFRSQILNYWKESSEPALSTIYLYGRIYIYTMVFCGTPIKY